MPKRTAVLKSVLKSTESASFVGAGWVTRRHRESGMTKVMLSCIKQNATHEYGLKLSGFKYLQQYLLTRFINHDCLCQVHTRTEQTKIISHLKQQNSTFIVVVTYGEP